MSLNKLATFDAVPAPLVYTQVATLLTYGYFAMSLFGRQSFEERADGKEYSGYEINIYFPLASIVEIIVYIGWLRVAQDLFMPFGEDDEDFPMNYQLDRNFTVSMIMNDVFPTQNPPAIKDGYWEDTDPKLPYTVAAYHEKSRDKQPRYRLSKIRVAEHKLKFVPDTVKVKKWPTADDADLAPDEPRLVIISAGEKAEETDKLPPV